jgi:Domain of Unknown Function (DUF748)
MGRRARWILLGTALLLIVVRISLPFLVKDYVNHQLNRAQDYGGRLDGIHIQLWRGQYTIHSLQIFKKAGGVPVPLFSTPQMDLSIQWKELFHGSIVGVVVIHDPTLNFVSGPTTEQTQTGKEESWGDVLGSLFPFKINRLDIIQGHIHYKDPYSTPPVDIHVDQVLATATNFANSRNIKTALPAGITASGTTLGGGGLSLQVQVNPVAAAPTYQLTASITNVDLTALNNFLKAYGKFDVAHGVFALYSSAAAKDGNYEGYFKVFFDQLKVFQWDKDKNKDALEIFWQAIVGTLTTAFKNLPHNQLAARVPFSGSFGEKKIGVWSAVSTVLRNAFVHALVPEVDEKITVEGLQTSQQGPTFHAEPQTPDGSPTNKGAEKLVPSGDSVTNQSDQSH